MIVVPLGVGHRTSTNVTNLSIVSPRENNWVLMNLKGLISDSLTSMASKFNGGREKIPTGDTPKPVFFHIFWMMSFQMNFQLRLLIGWGPTNRADMTL